MPPITARSNKMNRKILLTSAEKKRRDEILSQLVELSRNGWRNARPSDYEPLERELREIETRQVDPRAAQERANSLHEAARLHKHLKKD
jgi:hypothetical protein